MESNYLNVANSLSPDGNNDQNNDVDNYEVINFCILKGRTFNLLLKIILHIHMFSHIHY